jgi:hypothetical protein
MVTGLDDLQDALPAVIRFFATDPAGKRIEIIASP